jgi:hypothetical protein
MTVSGHVKDSLINPSFDLLRNPIVLRVCPLRETRVYSDLSELYPLLQRTDGLEARSTRIHHPSTWM